MAHHRHHRGLTLIEAMLLLVILSIVAVAAGVGLQAVAKVPAKTDQIMAVNSVIVDKLEQCRSLAWASMMPTSSPATINGLSYTCTSAGTGTAASSTLTRTESVNGFSYTCTILVQYADPTDPDNGASKKSDFRRIDVTMAPQAAGSSNSTQTMRCYVTQP